MARTIYLLRRGMQLPNESSVLIGDSERTRISNRNKTAGRPTNLSNSKRTMRIIYNLYTKVFR